MGEQALKEHQHVMDQMYQTKGMGRIYGMNGTIGKLKMTKGQSVRSKISTNTFGRESEYAERLRVTKKPS